MIEAKKEVTMNDNYIDWPQIKHVASNVLTAPFWKGIASGFMMCVAWIFDDGRGLVPAVIVALLIALDSISGIVAAVRSGEGLSSRKSKRILWKFIIYGIAIITGRLLDKLLPVPAFAVVIEVFLGLTEGQSIIENLGKAGMPIPAKVSMLFELLRKEKPKDDK